MSMDRLRKAIIELAAEDFDKIGAMTDHTEQVVFAYNATAAVERLRGVNIALIDTDNIEREFS